MVVPQELLLDSVLFSICINDLEDGTERTLSKLAGDARTGVIHQECWVCFLVAWYKRDVNLLERVQQRTTKMTDWTI